MSVHPVPPTEDLELHRFLESLVAVAVANPKSASHRGRLAMAYDANGFKDAAVKTYRQTSQLDPTDFRWPYLMSLAQASQGRIEDAIRDIDRAIELNATYSPSLLAKGFWLVDVGEYVSACETFEQTLRVLNDSRDRLAANLGLAQCRLELGDVEIAQGILDSLTAENLPPYAVMVRDRVSRARGKLTESDVDSSQATSVERLAWSDPIAGAVVEYTRGLSGESILAQKLIDSGRTDDALQLLNSLRDRYPEEPHLVELQSAALVELDKPDAAVDLLQTELRVFPDSYRLHLNLGWLLESIGQIDAALSHYDRAIELNREFVVAYDAKVMTLINRGSYGTAQDTLNASLAYRTLDSKTAYLLGVLAGQNGDWQASVKYLEHAIDLQPLYVDAHASLALSLSEQQRFDEALTSIKRARAIEPSNPKVERAIETLIANGVLVAD